MVQYLTFVTPVDHLEALMWTPMWSKDLEYDGTSVICISRCLTATSGHFDQIFKTSFFCQKVQTCKYRETKCISLTQKTDCKILVNLT
jgi:hypothetical protein